MAGGPRRARMRENWGERGQGLASKALAPAGSRVAGGRQGSAMSKFLEELKIDLRFVGSHTLQPRWYKLLKVFLLAGSLVGYWFLFGPMKTMVFLAVFFLLSLLVHLVYRAKTDTWKRSWLDFVVVEENGGPRPARIGAYYYSAVVLDAVIAVVVSQMLG